MDDETKAAIKRLSAAIDNLAGMTAGCAAYIATLEGAVDIDRRKAVGVSRRLAPEGLSGEGAPSPALVAQVMIDEIANLALQIQALKHRAQAHAPHPLSRDWTGRPAELNPALDYLK